jgi:hypothetical protein
VLAQETVVLPVGAPVGLSAQLETVTVLVAQESLKRVFQLVPSYTWNVHELLLVELRLRVCK